ncbi:beta/gamma crystallin-related protein [Oxalobacteraceae bacterium A2-2]
MKKILSTAVFLGAALIGLAAQAGEIVLYTHANFGGPSVVIHGTEPDLNRLGFNDRTSSVIVQSGTWEVCEHANFGGQCRILQRGEYPVLDGFNDVMSSVREVQERGPGRGPGGYDRDDRDGRGGRGGWNGGGRDRDDIVLFARADFGGRRVALDHDARTLDNYDFNDAAGSIVINEGVWELCEHADFRGRCVTLRPGRYDHLDYLNNRISSLRRVR